MADKNENVVVAIFPDQDAADTALRNLRNWDNANDDIKLGAVGTITKQGDKVKTHVGHKAGRGAKVGAVVGLVGGILTGGLSLVGGAIGGSLLGGAAGGVMKQSLHLTKEEIELIGNELDAGKVALVATCDEDEIEATSQVLKTLGGTVRNYSVPQDALTEATQALAVAEGAETPPAATAGATAAVALAVADGAEAPPAEGAEAPLAETKPAASVSSNVDAALAGAIADARSRVEGTAAEAPAVVEPVAETEPAAATADDSAAPEPPAADDSAAPEAPAADKQ